MSEEAQARDAAEYEALVAAEASRSKGRLVRYALALLVVAVAWSAAVYVHQRNIVSAGPGNIFEPNSNTDVTTHPSWEDPVAVLLAVGGVAVAVAIVATGRRVSE